MPERDFGDELARVLDVTSPSEGFAARVRARAAAHTSRRRRTRAVSVTASIALLVGVVAFDGAPSTETGGVAVRAGAPSDSTTAAGSSDDRDGTGLEVARPDPDGAATLTTPTDPSSADALSKSAATVAPSTTSSTATTVTTRTTSTMTSPTTAPPTSTSPAGSGDPTIPKPTLLAPEPGHVVRQSDPSIGCPPSDTHGYGHRIDFDWSDVDAPFGTKSYHLYFARRGARYPVISREFTSSELAWVSCNGFVSNGNRDGWFWRVRVKDQRDVWGPWTEERELRWSELPEDGTCWGCSPSSTTTTTFTTTTTEPGDPSIPAPQLVAPEPHHVVQQNDPSIGCPPSDTHGYGHRIDFDWSDVDAPHGTRQYHLILARHGSQHPAESRVVTASELTRVTCNGYVADRNRDNWFWKVRTQDQRGNWGSWSEERPLSFSCFNNC